MASLSTSCQCTDHPSLVNHLLEVQYRLNQVSNTFQDIPTSDFAFNLSKALQNVITEISHGDIRSVAGEQALRVSVVGWRLMPSICNDKLWNLSESPSKYLEKVFEAWNRDCKYVDFLCFLRSVMTWDREKYYTSFLDSICGAIANDMLKENYEYVLLDGEMFDAARFIADFRKTILLASLESVQCEYISEVSVCESALSIANSTKNLHLAEISNLKLGIIQLFCGKLNASISTFSDNIGSPQTDLVYKLSLYCAGFVFGLLDDTKQSLAHYSQILAHFNQDWWICSVCQLEIALLNKDSTRDSQLAAARISFHQLRFASIKLALLAHYESGKFLKAKRVEDAERLIQESLESGEEPLEQAHIPVVAYLFFRLCEVAVMKGDMPGMQHAIYRSKAVFLALGMYDECAEMFIFLIKSFFASCKYPQSLELSYSALTDCCEPSDSLPKLSIILNLIAKIYTKLGHFQLSKDISNLVIQYEEKAEDIWTAAKADALRCLGFIYWKKERNYPLAEICYIQCINIRCCVKDCKRLIKAYLSLAVLYFRSKIQPLEVCISLLNNALSLCKDCIKPSKLIFSVLHQSAICFKSQHDWGSVYENCIEARTYEYMAGKRERIECRELLIDACRAMGKDEEMNQYAVEQVKEVENKPESIRKRPQRPILNLD